MSFPSHLCRGEAIPPHFHSPGIDRLAEPCVCCHDGTDTDTAASFTLASKLPLILHTSPIVYIYQGFNHVSVCATSGHHYAVLYRRNN